MFLMRDERRKEERSKQDQTNKQGKAHSTCVSVPHMCKYITLFFCQYFSMMASLDRGQPPAWHTKVVDESQRPLKTGSKPICVSVCDNEVTSFKVQFTGEGMWPMTNRLLVCL